MAISVILKDIETGSVDEAVIDNPESRRCFSYVDNEKCNCEMCIYDDGLCFFRETEDHLLELHFRKNNYAKITSAEGELKLSAKILDFNLNDDILVVRYIIEDQEKEIKVIYRS